MKKLADKAKKYTDPVNEILDLGNKVQGKIHDSTVAGDQGGLEGVQNAKEVVKIAKELVLKGIEKVLEVDLKEEDVKWNSREKEWLKFKENPTKFIRDLIREKGPKAAADWLKKHLTEKGKKKLENRNKKKRC